MCVLLKLDYAKSGVSNLFLSKVIKEKSLGDPLGKGRVNPIHAGISKTHSGGGRGVESAPSS